MKLLNSRLLIGLAGVAGGAWGMWEFHETKDKFGNSVRWIDAEICEKISSDKEKQITCYFGYDSHNLMYQTRKITYYNVPRHNGLVKLVEEYSEDRKLTSRKIYYDKPSDGVYSRREYYSSAGLCSSTIGFDKYGKEHGKSITYSDINYNRSSEKTWCHGQPTHSIEWFPTNSDYNNVVKCEKNYKDGLLDGECTNVYRDGTKEILNYSKNSLNGVQTKIDTNGKTVSIEMWTNGKLNGLSYYMRAPNKILKKEYVAGILITESLVDVRKYD